MKIDLYSSNGAKAGSLELPPSLFDAPIHPGLMHEALVRQQGNRRRPIAHAKHRGEMVGSTKKLFQQKHTGRARRGAVRSPLLKGGGKSFGPRNEANFRKEMPKKMRRVALLSCLSQRAKDGVILGLKEYPDTVKTKEFATMLSKLPVDIGRRILIVLPTLHRGIVLSARNIPGVKTLLVSYLNPEDLLVSKHIIFMEEAVRKAVELFGKRIERKKEGADVIEATEGIEVVKKREKRTSEQKSEKTVTKKASRVGKDKRMSVPSETSATSVTSLKKK